MPSLVATDPCRLASRRAHSASCSCGFWWQVDAELCEDFISVSAQGSARETHRSRGNRQPRCDSLHLNAVYVDDCLPVPDLLIGEDVGNGAHGCDCCIDFEESSQYLFARASGNPVDDEGLEIVTVLEAGLEGGEAWIAGNANEFQNAFCNRVIRT